MLTIVVNFSGTSPIVAEPAPSGSVFAWQWRSSTCHPQRSQLIQSRAWMHPRPLNFSCKPIEACCTGSAVDSAAMKLRLWISCKRPYLGYFAVGTDSETTPRPLLGSPTLRREHAMHAPPEGPGGRQVAHRRCAARTVRTCVAGRVRRIHPAHKHHQGQHAPDSPEQYEAKQEAMDRGVNSEIPEGALTGRCQVVFASLDLTQDLCHAIGPDDLPESISSRV